MARRGRTPGFKLTDEHRGKIQSSNILNALIEHGEGRREMAASQVSACTALLRKILPDLAAIDVSGHLERPLSQMSDGELETIIAAEQLGKPGGRLGDLREPEHDRQN